MKAYLLMSVPYIVGGVAGWFIFLWLTPNADNVYSILWGLFVADLCATVVVWLSGVIFRNSSFYDPYWSLIPWLLVLGVMIRFSFWSASAILFLTVLGIWSWRLTINWAYTCKNLKTEDWRYTQYRKQNQVLVWHIINFFGINLIPTLVVFTALIPGILLIAASDTIGVFHIIGASILLVGVVLETSADISMHKFLNNSVRNQEENCPRKVNTNGLWKYSRHPNYLGEIMVWMGVYVSALHAPGAAWWLLGWIAVILLFLGISIPLAEKRHLLRRPDYAAYQKNTRMLLPIPKAKKITLSKEDNNENLFIQ